ncbi:hypothetical protein ACFFLS_22450 [Flavobacterium procerum]|uniref:DUF4468 domain-containing protein n=1 Tax=Flavobacterium procerum TaxID=1455569 RepID=A0ABV6BYX5_9FLAO
MKKNLALILLLSVTVCFSQNDSLTSKNREFSIQQIDSICEIKDYKLVSKGMTGAEMKIESPGKATEIILGKGTFSYTIHLFHFDEAYYNSLTRKEQNKYNFSKKTRLLKAEYSSGLFYENGFGEITKGEFYYFKDALFHVKIKLARREKNKKDTIQEFDLSIAELNNSNTIENILSMNLKNWITEQSDKIIKKYKDLR